jgi:pimeloyl-ACP methyl ester carboxylesterase
VANHIPGPLHYESQGKHGPLMLFMHGNPYDHRLWMYQTAHFSTWFRTVAVDLPAYGRSPAGQPGLTIGDMADACWEALDSVAREPVILVGNSVGASISIEMAGKRPAQARAMILTGCAYMPNRDFARMGGGAWDKLGIGARRESMLRFVSPGRRGDPLTEHLLQMFLADNERIDAKAVREIFHALEQPEPEAVYDGLNLPCIVIAGTEDPSYPGAQALQKRIRGAELTRIEGGSHVSNLDYPAEWNRAALDFLKRRDLL